MIGSLTANKGGLAPSNMRYYLNTFVGTGAQAPVTIKLAASITSFVWNRTNPHVVTITTAASADHMLETGDSCTVVCSDQSNLNITRGRVTWVSATVFTVELGSIEKTALMASASATVSSVHASNYYVPHIYAMNVTIHAQKARKTANTGDVYIGPYNSTYGAGFATVAMATGTVYDVPIAVGATIDLSQIYLEVATANDGAVLLFH